MAAGADETTVRKELANVSKHMITELKAFATPPPAVQTTLTAMYIILEGKKPKDEAKDCKKMLAERGFLERIKTHQFVALPDKSKKLLAPIVDSGVLDPETVMKSSLACGYFAKWVLAAYAV